MKKVTFLILLLTFVGLATTMQSCLDDDGDKHERYLAVATVYPQADGGFLLAITESQVVKPSNVTESPYGDKKARVLTEYYFEPSDPANSSTKEYVHICWMNEILSKAPVAAEGEFKDKYGYEPIAIVEDWLTIAEDGYLTLHLRTDSDIPGIKHEMNLAVGDITQSPIELTLCHSTKGVSKERSQYADGPIAFPLEETLADLAGQTVKLKLNWNSYDGEKSREFELKIRDNSIANPD